MNIALILSALGDRRCPRPRGTGSPVVFGKRSGARARDRRTRPRAGRAVERVASGVPPPSRDHRGRGRRRERARHRARMGCRCGCLDRDRRALEPWAHAAHRYRARWARDRVRGSVDRTRPRNATFPRTCSSATRSPRTDSPWPRSPCWPPTYSSPWPRPARPDDAIRSRDIHARTDNRPEPEPELEPEPSPGAVED